MQKYNLSFISDKDLFQHVKQTVESFRIKISWKDFQKNIIDPIKLTFDSLIYEKTFESLIEGEVIRQIDKSNNNSIGRFHQYIFEYIGGKDWEVPKKGFDLINLNKNIFVEIKNKHNTMNSSSSQKTYMRMLNQISNNPNSTCYLLEVIAKQSQDCPWSISLDGEKIEHNGIRRISIDKFYEIITKDKLAFYKLCQILPTVIKEVIKPLDQNSVIENTVMQEIRKIYPNLGDNQDYLSLLYQIAFKTYEGF